MPEIIRDLWDFMRHGKRYWLLPIITILLLMGVVITTSEGSALLPFIYAIF